MKETLLIAESDNVSVALRNLGRGETTDAGLRLANDVPAGHKVAIRRIPTGEKVVKYGYPIGVASVDILPGEHVHSHNLVSTLRDDISERGVVPAQASPSAHDAVQPASFDGYRRADGRVGIRNEIWIINTVGCVNNAAERIAAAATRELGCENNQLTSFLGQVGPMSSERVASFNAQDVEDEVEEGLARVRQLARHAGRFQRESVPASELILGMKCGGSDGLSGITANPLVGKVANRLSALGGSVLLTEVPEMFGAEGVLLERARSQEVARDTIDLVNRFRAYFRRYDEPIDENPAPGNKAGGITTLAEKSLGCVQKAGQAPVVRVLDYGERAPSRLGGTALVNAPGNDGVSSTALVAAGAHMVLFTTGRGTPMGFPAPTIKISTNSPLAARKPSWIDFDAGPIALGTSDFGPLSGELFQLVLDVASGRRRTKSEINGFREISIWKDGVTL